MYDENLKDKEKMMEDKKYREEQGILLTKENTDTELQTRSLLHLKIQNSFQFLKEKNSLLKVFAGQGCIIRLVTLDELQCTENVVS